MRRSLLSIWSWFALGVIVIVWTPLVAVVRLVTLPFDKGRYATGYVFRRLCVIHQVLTPMWRFRTSGQLPADKRHPYVMVSNHESFVDMLLISHLKIEMKWLSKKSIFNIPLVGWMMKMSGDIPLVRGDRSSGSAALDLCKVWLDRKVSVMISPRGPEAPTVRCARSRTVRSDWRSRPGLRSCRWWFTELARPFVNTTGVSGTPGPRCGFWSPSRPAV